MAVASYYYIQTPATFLPLYAISCLLDAVDGHAARFLKQCSFPIQYGLHLTRHRLQVWRRP